MQEDTMNIIPIEIEFKKVTDPNESYDLQYGGKHYAYTAGSQPLDLILKRVFNRESHLTENELKEKLLNLKAEKVKVKKGAGSVFVKFKIDKQVVDLYVKNNKIEAFLKNKYKDSFPYYQIDDKDKNMKLMEQATNIPHFLFLASLDEEHSFDLPYIEELTDKIAQDPHRRRWQNYIIRKEAWDNMPIYSNAGTQEPYGRLMDQSVLMGQFGLEKCHFGFLQLFNLSAYRRSLIANELQHKFLEHYGSPKTDYAFTDISADTYAQLGPKLRDKIDSLGDALQGENYEISCSIYGTKAKVQHNIDGEKVTLSTIEIDADVPLSWKSEPVKGKATLVHAATESFAKVYQKLEQVYEQIRHTTDKDEIMCLAGTLFWLICQGKFWFKGDPSIAQMIVGSILQAKGLENLPWKRGIVPWEETMLEWDCEKFAKNFHLLFEKP